MEDGGRCLHSDRPPAKLLKCMRTKREHQVNGQESYRAHPFDHMEARTLAQQCVREPAANGRASGAFAGVINVLASHATNLALNSGQSDLPCHAIQPVKSSTVLRTGWSSRPEQKSSDCCVGNDRRTAGDRAISPKVDFWRHHNVTTSV